MSRLQIVLDAHLQRGIPINPGFVRRAPPPSALLPTRSLLRALFHTVFHSCSHTLTDLFLRFRADSHQLQPLSLAPFNLHKTRVRRASGFLLTAFSNARPNPLFRSILIIKGAPPKKH